MIEVEPFAILRVLLGIAYVGLQFAVPVWLCARFHVWGLILSIPFLWGLRLSWLMALPAVDAQADTNAAMAWWYLAGLPTCFLSAGIIFGLTMVVKAIIRKRQPTPAAPRPSRLRLMIVGVSLVVAALIYIEGLAAVGRGADTGPTIALLGISDRPWRLFGSVENRSTDTMRNVVVTCEVVDGDVVLERFTFQRETFKPGEAWEIKAPVRNKDLLARLAGLNTNHAYRTKLTAERGRWGPLVFLYRRETTPRPRHRSRAHGDAPGRQRGATGSPSIRVPTPRGAATAPVTVRDD